MYIWILSDLVEVVKKRMCDMRWEVKDSTVEFLGHLAGVCDSIKAAAEECDASEALLGGCSTTPLLREALQDSESYVRASAISALAKTLTHRWQQGATLTEEEVGRNCFSFSLKTVGTKRGPIPNDWYKMLFAANSRPMLDIC